MNNNDPLGTGHFISGRMPGFAPKGKKKKTFLEDQISTGGGMAGAAGGAALGAAAGSVVPVVGTAIGGILGAILGGAGGSGLGQRVENSVVGDELNKDVAKEALLGGLFGAGPIRGANMAFQGGRAALNGAGRGGIKSALEQAAVATPIRNALGRGASSTSDNLAVKGLRLNSGQVTKFKEKFGEDVVTTIKRNGLIGRNADEIGAARQGLNDEFSSIATNAPDVNKADIMKRLNAVAAQLNKAGPSDSKRTAQDLLAEAQTSLAGFGDTIPAATLNGLRRNFDSLVNYTEKTANPARYGVNKRMADALRQSLQQTADTAGMTASGGQSLKQVGSELQKLSQLQKVAARQEGLGRGSGPIGLRDALSMGGSGAAGGLAGGPVGAVLGAAGGMAASKVANSPTAIRAATRALDGVARRNANRSVNPLGIGGIIGRAATVEGADQMLFPSGLLDIENEDEQIPVADLASYFGAGAGGEQESAVANNPFGVTQDEVAQLMMVALANGDEAGLKQLKQLHDMVAESATVNDLNSTAAASLAMSDNGIGTLEQLESLYASAGNGSGKVGGSIKSRLGKYGLDDSTAAYEALASSATSQLAKAINGGGQVSDADAAALIAALPKVTDSPDVARTKFAALKQRLATARQNMLMYNSGSAE